MNDEQLIHDIVNNVNMNSDAIKSHPANANRSLGTYNDVDTKLKGDGFQEWPKYTDPIKQREQ